MERLGASCSTTRRLQIQPLRREHAPALFAALSHARIYDYLCESAPHSVQALMRRYRRLERGAPPGAGESWLNWAVRLRHASIYIGTLQATVTHGRAASVAYVVAPRFWGRGYAVEACRWLIDHLAHRHRVVEFHATVDARNERSWRLLQRLSFERIGQETVECRGAMVEDFIYRLRRRSGHRKIASRRSLQ